MKKNIGIKLIPFLMIISILSIIVYSLFKPVPIIIDPVNTEIITVIIRIDEDGSQVTLPDSQYDAAELLECLKGAEKRRTFSRSGGYEGRLVDVSIFFRTNDTTYFLFLGRLNIVHEGNNSVIFKVLHSEELKEKVYSILNYNNVFTS